MKKAICIVLVLCLSSISLLAQQQLPIRRVLLYKNGMSYIVRAGQIGAPLSLAFRPDEMNDVLKTFSAWNPDNSSLYPVGYTTGIAANEVLKRFPFDLRAPENGLAAFLLQIKGAAIRLDLGIRTLSGQLLGIVPEDRAVQQQTIVKDYRLTILTTGNVQTVWLSDVRSLDFQDPALTNQLRSYLEVLAEGQDVTREVTIYPAAAAGPVNVAYVQQFPIWKTTYRVDLNKEDSRIQGWAQIDNPTGEAWSNVDLTLISGMPTSFTMDLYQPLYASRSAMKVPSSIVAAPRQYEAALDINQSPVVPNAIYGAAARDGSNAMADSMIGQRGAQGQQGRGMGPGVGGALGGVLGGVMASREAPPPQLAPVPGAPMAQMADATRGQDYFEYRFPFAIQLGSRQSALLPFLNKPIKADRVSIFKAGVDREHPLNGAWLENNADLPLDAGPITFFQNGQYAGETVVDYLSRGEKRLVSYGVDYDVQADSRTTGRPETTTRITASRGVVTLFRETAQTTNYTFRNKGQDAKTLILEHPRTPQRTLKDLKPEETTSAFYRFRLNVQPGRAVEFPVAETLSRQMAVNIRDIHRASFDLTFSGTEIPAELRTRLMAIIAEREKLAELQVQKPALADSLKSIFNDQERVRENLKALGDRREEKVLRQKYLSQLEAQEQQVTDLRTKVEDLDRRIAEQELLVSRLISELTWS